MKQYIRAFQAFVLKFINCKISNPRAYGLRNIIPIKIIKLNKIQFDFKNNEKL